MSQPALRAAIARHDLTIHAEFIPFSRSRNSQSRDPSLNWVVTLSHKGRPILTTEYMAGSAHCPAYERKDLSSSLKDAAIDYECRHGVAAGYVGDMAIGARSPQVPILPDSADVIWSLIQDSDVLNYKSFEDWAPNLGYDSDSRKAESIYEACLEIALQLRLGLGESILADLIAASQDY